MDAILSTSDWQSSVCPRPSASTRADRWHVPFTTPPSDPAPPPLEPHGRVQLGCSFFLCCIAVATP
eukprot:3697494-Rhodomonas_salina.1